MESKKTTACESKGGSSPAGSATAACPAADGSDTPLNKSVLDKIAKCPAMKSDLDALQKAGWKVEYGTGAGSFCNKQTKTITIDPGSKGKDDQIVATMAHEMGHAQYNQPSVSPTGKTKPEYVAASVQENLKDEGAATLKQIEYKKCLKAGGGPDIPISGAKAAEYVKVADKYPKAEDKDKAINEIANLFGDGERPSNCPSQTYRQYYSKPCKAEFGTGAQGYADSLTDEQWKNMGGKI